MSRLFLREASRRPAGDFFGDFSAVEEDVLLSLFRAADDIQNDAQARTDIERYLEICRAGIELERLLDRPPHSGPPTYDLPPLRAKMDAVEQGTFVAEQERRRLALGHNPILDMADLINAQKIWASGAHLPDQMSGLFLRHSSIGLFILVNFKHVRARKRFSYAHEYAHALLDRSRAATVSRENDRADMREVRANAFAAAFLLPRSGVWAFLHARSKAGPSFEEQSVYDPAAERQAPDIRASRRAAPGSQELTYEDVGALAHNFRVSYQAALYRLKSLSIINDAAFATLRDKESVGKDLLVFLEMLEDIDGEERRRPDRDLISQVLHLTLEAYRCQKISKDKLRELSSPLCIPAGDLLALADEA
jgi:Zn-dependent peptidase ImmA (M78 family)